MRLLKLIVKNHRLILLMSKNDFRNKYSYTNFGAVWGFITPLIFMLTYVIVFEYILKTGSSGEYPYIVWFLPGIAVWMFLSDGILSTSNSVRNYSYLVKKVVFPVEIIPVISIASSLIVYVFSLLITSVVGIFSGYPPNLLQLVYFVLASIAYVLAVTRLTTAICTLVSDFTQFLTILMQILFWFTPVVWNIEMVGPGLRRVVAWMPFTYLVTGLRGAFIGQPVLARSSWADTALFWLVTVIFFVYGEWVFNRVKREFADVL